MTTSYYILKALMKTKSELEFKEHFSRTTEIKCFDKTKEEMNSRCRVCLRRGTVDIYGGDPNTVKISEALQTIAGVEVIESDNNPKMLCTICYQFIKTALLFRKTAKRSEDILKQPISKSSVKVELFAANLDESSHNENDNNTDEDVSDSKPSEELWAGLKTEEIKMEKKDKTKCSSKVTCPICKKVVNRTYFKEHATLHDPDHKKYVCDVCGKAFRLRCAYHNHSLRHRNDFPYKCTFCPYRGRYAELLKTHMRTHTGDYSYMCSECPARFLFKSNLNSHMLKHKEPQFKCDTCNRAFHSSLTLQRHHEADHLGIKNHVCNMCGKAFGYRNAMMKHQRHVHKREKLLFGRMPSYLAEQKQNG